MVVQQVAEEDIGVEEAAAHAWLGSEESVSATTSFPNRLKITVHEYIPVARVTTAAGRRVAAASDGTLLPRLGQKKLPTGSGIEASGRRRSPCRTTLPVSGRELRDVRPALKSGLPAPKIGGSPPREPCPRLSVQPSLGPAPARGG